MSLGSQTRSGACRFLAELLLYPEDRDRTKLAALGAELEAAWPARREVVQALLAGPDLDSCDDYLQTFEIESRVPLYLGHYLFQEPTNCRGAAVCGRNNYMIQLKNLYRHFGLQMDEGELPDFLPLMLEFLALSAGHRDQGRRRWMIQHYMLPALPAFNQALTKADNVYTPVAAMLEEILREEAGETPAAEPHAPAAAELCDATRT